MVNSSQSYHPICLWSHNSRLWKNRDTCIYLLRFIAVASGGYKNDFNLNMIATSEKKKNSPANVNKVSAAILNLVSFSLFDRRDSDKPEDEYTHAPQAQNRWCMRQLVYVESCMGSHRL